MLKKNSAYLKASTLLLISTLWVSHAAIAPALPGMAKQFSYIPEADLYVKLSLTIASLFIGIFSPFTGIILDRFGRLPTLFISLFILSFSGISVFIIDNIYLILVSRAIAGGALGAMITTVLTLIGDYYQGEERKKMVGLQSAFIAIGGVVYLGGNGILADISWRLAFLVYGVALFLLVPAIRYFNEPGRSQKDPHRNSGKVRSVYAQTSFLEVGWVIFSCLLVSVFFIMIHTQLPFLLKEIGYEKNIWMGVIAVAFNVTAVVSSLLFPRIKRNFSFSVIYSFMFLSFAISYFIFGYCKGFHLLLTGAFISGIGVGFIMPNSSLWLLTITSPSIRGKMMGVMTFSMFLGQFLSPLLVRPLLKFGTIADVFIYAAVFMTLLATVYLIPFKISKPVLRDELE